LGLSEAFGVGCFTATTVASTVSILLTFLAAGLEGFIGSKITGFALDDVVSALDAGRVFAGCFFAVPEVGVVFLLATIVALLLIGF